MDAESIRRDRKIGMMFDDVMLKIQKYLELLRVRLYFLKRVYASNNYSSFELGELINSKEIERRDKILEDDRILEQMVKVREMELYDDFLNDELGTTEYSEEFLEMFIIL